MQPPCMGTGMSMRGSWLLLVLARKKVVSVHSDADLRSGQLIWGPDSIHKVQVADSQGGLHLLLRTDHDQISLAPDASSPSA